MTAFRKIDGRGLAVAPLSLDRGLKPGEITREALIALRPDVAQSSSDDPRALLSALRLSDEGLARNGGATFVVFVPDHQGQGGGRYLVVVDGIGLPESLR
jgi:outer membrane receptor protein involved in Fe transport